MKTISISTFSKEFDNVVYEFVKQFLNMDIKNAVASHNPLIQFFALIDRRCGRRTLEKIDVSEKQNFIKMIYNERMKSYRVN